jgi:hypothetical protein
MAPLQPFRARERGLVIGERHAVFIAETLDGSPWWR